MPVVTTKTTANANKYGKPVTNWAEVPVMFDPAYAVRLFRQGYHVIIKKCERGELPAFKIGREWRFRKSDVEAFMENQVQERYKDDWTMEGCEAGEYKNPPTLPLDYVFIPVDMAAVQLSLY